MRGVAPGPQARWCARSSCSSVSRVRSASAGERSAGQRPALDPAWRHAFVLQPGLETAFKRHWETWTLCYTFCFLIAMFIAISRFTGDRVALHRDNMCPLATAAFVSCGHAMAASDGSDSVAGYGAGEILFRSRRHWNLGGWACSPAVSLCANTPRIFIDRYRRPSACPSLRLEEAARLPSGANRDHGHDIRSPVAALSGYVIYRGR